MSFEKMMAELQLDYLKNLPQKIAEIEAHFSTGDLELLRNDFHKIKGTGKTYGLPLISEIGLVMESLCKAKSTRLGEALPLALSALRQIAGHGALATPPELARLKALL
jgi:HPt (histidine-containing phosphotransfer) domain-containing protein